MARQRDIGDVINLQDITHFVTSKVDKEVSKFLWKIDDFDKLEKIVISPCFSQSPLSKVQWQVKILPREDRQGETCVSIVLQVVKSNDFDSLTAKIQMGFLDSNRKIVTKVQNTQRFIGGKAYGQFSIPRREVIHRHRGYLSGDNNALMIYFFIETEGVFHSQQKYNQTTEIESFSDATRKESRPANSFYLDDSSIRKRFKSFLDDGDFADVTVATGASTFRASKIILSAQSPVFKALFQSDSPDVVQIGDFSDETVKTFLEFLYTDQIELLKENARDLLKISDKYQVVELKRKSEQVLLNELNIQNAAEILILSHLHSPTSLKPKVISFVNGHKNQVQKTETFQMLANTHPILFRDLYMALN